MKLSSSAGLRILLLSAALLAGILLRGAFFHTSVSLVPTTSDEAAAVIMAQSIAQGERPLLFIGTPYQFPFSAYLMAPMAHLLPADAFGARVFPAVLAALAIAGFYLVLRRIAPREERWPGILMVLCPSAYVLTLQSAYFIPQYTATLTFAWLLPLLAVLALQKRRNAVWVLLAGVVCGFALSVHLLSLPLVAMTALAVVLGTSWRSALKNTLLFIPACGLGLWPYLATYTPAARAVTGRHSLETALDRLLGPLIADMAGMVLGFRVSHFPDFHSAPGMVPGLLYPAMIGLGIFFLMAAGISGYGILLRTFKQRWPTLTVHEIFIGTIGLNIAAFVFSRRGWSTEFRYLLPLAWAFPFMVVYLYGLAGRRGRMLLGTVVILMAGLNVAQSVHLIAVWRTPGFARQTADLQPIEPVMDYLEEQRITHFYASFWWAYRFTFASQGRLVCSQPFNERFRKWPLPYKDAVDQSPRAAYVLTNTPQARAPAHKFIKMLKYHQFDATVKRIGPNYIFHDFTFQGYGPARQVTPDQFTLTVDANPRLADRLVDGDPDTIWSSLRPQDRSMAIQFDFDIPRTIYYVRVFFDPRAFRQTPSYRILGSSDGIDWIVLKAKIRPRIEKFRIGQGHPYFAKQFRQDHPLAPTRIKALRIMIQTPQQGHPWSLGEIAILEQTEPAPLD